MASEHTQVCGAGRSVGFSSSFSAENADDWFIMEVEGESVPKKQYIGLGNIPANKSRLIENCRRCVDRPNRLCDYSTSTWSETDPQ